MLSSFSKDLISFFCFPRDNPSSRPSGGLCVLSQGERNSNRKGGYLCPCLLIAALFYMKLSLDKKKSNDGTEKWLQPILYVLAMEIFIALLWVLPHFPTRPTITEKELKDVSSSFKAVFSFYATGFVDLGKLVSQQVILSGAALPPAGRRCNFQRSILTKCPVATRTLLSNDKLYHRAAFS